MEDENKTQPKLTLMEEVLLLGLKDKQVNNQPVFYLAAIITITPHFLFNSPFFYVLKKKCEDAPLFLGALESKSVLGYSSKEDNNDHSCPYVPYFQLNCCGTL